MLALTRKSGDYIMIGDNIMVKVVRTNGLTKLIVDAPQDIPIVRGEVYERMRRDTRDTKVSLEENAL